MSNVVFCVVAAWSPCNTRSVYQITRSTTAQNRPYYTRRGKTVSLLSIYLRLLCVCGEKALALEYFSNRLIVAPKVIDHFHSIPLLGHAGLMAVWYQYGSFKKSSLCAFLQCFLQPITAVGFPADDL